MLSKLTFISLLFLTQAIRPDLSRSYFAVLNVGQGQWVRWATPHGCYDLDRGGERYSIPHFLKVICKSQNTTILITHFDKDHVNFIPYSTKSTCIQLPKLPIPKNKAKYIHKIPQCPQNQIPSSMGIFSPPHHLTLDRNSRSIGYQFQHYFVAGDATTTTEKHWIKHYKFWLKNITVLVAGHHGSKTSSSEYWIKNLKNLRAVAVSARKRRYGHPHALVTLRFKKHGVAMLTTEKWGHLIWTTPY